jgi:antitoxin component of RelBE/YafQ-DinJ toxin-antitoxin module
MKKSILNLRLDESTKEALDAKCLENGVSVSTGAREAIKKYLLPVENNLDQNCDTTLIRSLGFCEFIFWLLDKLRNPEVCEVECLFQQHMDLIIECKNNIYFDKDIQNEFMKVYYELYELLHQGTHDYSYFKFPQGPKGFDYDKLHAFMHTIRYDENDNKILYIK